MNDEQIGQMRQFVSDNIDIFHQDRLKLLQKLKLKDTLKRKNPYLFRAKNIMRPDQLVESLLIAHISSSEETLFGNFLEMVAIFINEMMFNGQKSPASYIDLDFTRDNVRYLVAIKSGLNWGNSSQQKALKEAFKKQIAVVRQNKQTREVRAVLGVCYGNRAETDNGDFLLVAGQRFWAFISGDPELYLRLIEPLGHDAQMHNDGYLEERTKLHNRLLRELMDTFCDEAGMIDWERLVRFNSQNIV